jgi:hypothetical protein
VFEHEAFDKSALSDVPLKQDICLMDAEWMRPWEAEWIKAACGADADPYIIGYITPVSVSKIAHNGLEISWYPNHFDRFHEVKTFLPADQIAQAVDVPAHDCRFTIFVRSQWLRQLHLRSHSLFVMIDAMDMSHEIEMGRINRAKLIALRESVDAIAKRHPHVSFISFADSLLLKTNWTVGMVGSNVGYTYSPEAMIKLFGEIRDAYRAILDLGIYGIFAQGSNEYYDDPLLHISESQNHISLNSLGLPFAQLQRIEVSARTAIRTGTHGRCELYLDEDFFNSLRFADYQARACSHFAEYPSKLSSSPGTYFHLDYDELCTMVTL